MWKRLNNQTFDQLGIDDLVRTNVVNIGRVVAKINNEWNKAIVVKSALNGLERLIVSEAFYQFEFTKPPKWDNCFVNLFSDGCWTKHETEEEAFDASVRILNEGVNLKLVQTIRAVMKGENNE